MSTIHKENQRNFFYNPNQSGSDDSDWGLEIVIKSTPKKRKQKSIDPKDKEIIDEFEKDIEETLEEKAAKSNLSHTTVKSILKHVFTDERVLALVKQKEGCEDVEGIIPYEPKITRSKAKELYSNAGALIPLPWQAPTVKSEVQALLTQDLQEDSSGDEYVPGEEESEDDASFTCSISNPPTPIAPSGTPNRSCIDELQDEVFKTPQRKEKRNRKQTENANIALRTRSKFSLSQTSLEKIEQAFIPPDITTDMYEVYCKDDEWKEFLTSFTQPLEEVVKGAEDEEHDPEYNFLSDEEIDKVDKEELRADKAVKVPRKELNDLMAELFEYTDIYAKKTEKEKMEYETTLDSTNQIQQQLFDSCIEILDCSNSDNSFTTKLNQNISNLEKNEIHSTEHCLNNAFTQSQLLLLHQQMRQHVQMLTQNFLLTYCHPVYDNFSSTLKEYLLNFKFLANDGKYSVFSCSNLENSLKLINRWERLFIENNEKALETTKHYMKVMEESINLHSKGEYYYLPFPPLVLETIADNDAFIYPYLLPRIPFKHPGLLKKDTSPFSYSEYQLIALGLEQFIPHFKNDVEFMTRKKQLNLRKISELICQLLMPARQPIQIYRQMIDKKKEKHLPNPIAYYNMHRKAPLTIHQVNPLIHFKTVSPRKRPPPLLPLQWRNYIWPDWKKTQDCEEYYFPKPAVMLDELKKNKPLKPLRRILPKIATALHPLRHHKIETSSHKRKPNDRYLNSFKKKFINCFEAIISYSEYYMLRRKSGLLNEFLRTERVANLLSEKDISETSDTPCSNLFKKGNMNITQESMNQTYEVEEHEPGIDNLLKEFEKNSFIPHQLRVLSIKKCEFEINSTKNSNLETTKMFNISKNSVEENSSIKENVPEKTQLSTLTDEKKSENLSRLSMLSPPELSSEKKAREQFARAYFKKFKNTLNEADYTTAVYLFQNSFKKTRNAIDLYKILKPILSSKYQHLANEFLLFLNIELAVAVGKLIPFFLTNHLDKFKQSFAVYFKDQPSQLKEINESFSAVDSSSNITLDKLKTTILPLLRSHPVLCDRFLQIFLKETSSSSLFNGAWEIVDINEKLSGRDKSVPDSKAVAETEESICTCFCHKNDDQQYRQHCIKCGLRFVRGKTYCHTSRGFKQVNITFPFDPNIDTSTGLLSQNCISPVDDTFGKKLNSLLVDRVKKGSASNEIEESIKEFECFNKLEPKLNSKATKNKMPVLKKHTSRRSRMKRIKFSVKSCSLINKPASCLEQAGSMLEDARSKCAGSLLCSDVTVPENDFSQNDVEMSSQLSNRREHCTMWSREEDKIILQTFKQKSEKEALRLVGKQLKHRSTDNIKTRFETLMALLQEMESSSQKLQFNLGEITKS